MSDISTVGARFNGADLEYYDKASGNTVLAYRNAIGSLPIFSFADNLTAHSGGTKAAAFQLTALVNNVATVAAVGDSVLLPVATPGLDVTVINSGANPMQVFGAGSDTINGVATATGVVQIQASVVVYSCTAAGKWFAIGLGSGYNAQYPTIGSQDNQTAIGSNRAGAFVIAYELTRFSTVAASTGAVLPAAAAGLSFTIINAGANTLTVYANGSDTINGTAGATGVSLASGKTATYFSASTGTWHALLSA